MLFNLFNDYKTSYEFAYYTLSQELNEPAHKLYYFLRFIVESYDIFPVQIKDERKRLISLLSEVGIKDDKDLKNSIFYPVINIFFENILFDVESIE
jgi:hypothetical protein